MTEASKRLLAAAQRLADIYRAQLPVKAALVTGSVAQGVSDDISDVDMCLYYEEMPSAEAIQAVRELAGGGERLLFAGDPAEGACIEIYPVAGVKHDFAHSTFRKWEENMAEVLEKHQADSPMQKAIAGLLDGLPLYGEEIIARWKAKAADYPEALQMAMVQKHLFFYPPWVPERMALERDDLLFLYDIFVQAEKNILGILLGLNRLYHWGEYKRMDTYLQQMTIAPADLSARLKRLLREEPRAALVDLDRLIDETFALVETHLPQVDITATTARYRRPFGV
ncbi:MAG TPA: hypothetical protein VKU00_27250 [Chthonomonadaceae bacterium]|nr:hypothetical protein [Chthonomonadaceae bacterium]